MNAAAQYPINPRKSLRVSTNLWAPTIERGMTLNDVLAARASREDPKEYPQCRGRNGEHVSGHHHKCGPNDLKVQRHGVECSSDISHDAQRDQDSQEFPETMRRSQHGLQKSANGGVVVPCLPGFDIGHASAHCSSKELKACLPNNLV